MAIPESQLETWANQGATVTSQATHTSIRAALEHANSPIADRIGRGDIQVYLQGSYRNDTNTRGDSDVDVLVELVRTFGHNTHQLPLDQRQAHEAAYDAAQYRWANLRADVVTALQRYYGAVAVDVSGNKSIALAPANGRLKADVVPVISYRSYAHFHGPDNYEAHEGIQLFHRGDNRSIVNFPRQHYENGVAKNSDARSGGMFKPVVRIFKNARSYAVDHGLIAEGVAPSYFLQSLVYNAPDHLFSGSYADTVLAILRHWRHEMKTTDILCQNGMVPLFGTSPDQWNTSDAATTISVLCDLWDNWNN